MPGLSREAKWNISSRLDCAQKTALGTVIGGRRVAIGLLSAPALHLRPVVPDASKR